MVNGPAQQHILLTALGIYPKKTKYAQGEGYRKATVAPAALYWLLPPSERPKKVVALCTAEAESTSYPDLVAQLESACPVEAVEISADATPGAIYDFLARLTEVVPRGADLTLDVTHGLRHQAFLTYAGVIYLTAMRGVRLRGAYYGKLADEPDGISQFVDIRPLVELPRWFHAVQVLAETGSASAIAGMVERSGSEHAEQLSRALRELSQAYGWGLPIELGYLARRFHVEQADALRELLNAQRLPLADELVDDFAAALAKQAFEQELPATSWKTAIKLDKSELARLAGIIDSYLARDDYPNAFGLMREWLILWVLWRTGEADRWIDFQDRKLAWSSIKTISARMSRGEPVTEKQRIIGTLWKHLVALRNPYAHRGLDRNVMLPGQDEVTKHAENAARIWRETFRHVPEFSPGNTDRSETRALVSPIGMHKGVLFSALRQADPSRVTCCVVICSADSENSITDATRATGYAGEVVPLRLNDPFGGVNELARLRDEALSHLADVGDVLVNVTGGTTLMGVLAERIASGARSRGECVHRFALIDRRSPAEQTDDPYRPAGAVWLDDPPSKTTVDAGA